jgi:hypothetical protein
VSGRFCEVVSLTFTELYAERPYHEILTEFCETRLSFEANHEEKRKSVDSVAPYSAKSFYPVGLGKGRRVCEGRQHRVECDLRKDGCALGQKSFAIVGDVRCQSTLI